MDTSALLSRKNVAASKAAILVVTVAVLLGAACPLLASTCASLRELKLQDTTITSAQTVPAVPAGVLNSTLGSGSPAFCRVIAQVKPAKDSDIQVEVWMPAAGWNGKYQGQGNGGFAGYISYPEMTAALRQGYATAGTDTGHKGTPVDSDWSRGHPEKVIDFGYRGIHEMTVKAKAIIKAFYRAGPRHSYFAACSNGGREALMEAQRFPEDYDGILAGAPAYQWTHLLTAAVWNMQATLQNPASYIPPEKIPAISAGVLAACDAKDGITDGVLSDPASCHFDPAVLLCKAGDSAKCLTTPQVAAVRKLYAGPHNAKGEQIFPGFAPGGEDGPGGWKVWITGSARGKALQVPFGNGFFSNMVYADPAWDFRKFDFDTGLKFADQTESAALNATSPDLKKFRQRGGKLIVYHGWSDPAISPFTSIAYYDSMVRQMGASDTQAFARLYMAPGMQHCDGGPGPDSFGQQGNTQPADPGHNVYAALERWVEKGEAPSQIVATKFEGSPGEARRVKMTRPLCPYPQSAKYKGTGDSNDAANFECVVAPR